MVVNDNNPWLGRDVHDTRMRNDVDVVRLCLCGDRPGDKTTGNAASEATGKAVEATSVGWGVRQS